MPKITPSKPFLVLLYGYPGAGKSYFARQFSEQVQAAHLQLDKIRSELFQSPRFDASENQLVNQVANFMTSEFLSNDLSVVYDTNAMLAKQRKYLSDLAHACHAYVFLIWFQLDQETAFARNTKRDRRRADDRFAVGWDRPTFDDIIGHMQNPSSSEDYIVVSGKHLYQTQRSPLLSKMRSKGIFGATETGDKIVKPGMVNIVPQWRSRYESDKRNISIR